MDIFFPLHRKRASKKPQSPKPQSPIVRALPSFLANRTVKKKSNVPTRIFTYDREIICIPQSFLNANNLVKIPRKSIYREFLVINNLIGNIRLRSDMSEDNIMSEIRSVFRVPMNKDTLFDFKILQPSGGSSKSLSIRQVSSSYKWTASTIAGKYSKVPIYILARDELKLVKKTIEDEEYSGISEDDTPAKKRMLIQACMYWGGGGIP